MNKECKCMLFCDPLEFLQMGHMTNCWYYQQKKEFRPWRRKTSGDLVEPIVNRYR